MRNKSAVTFVLFFVCISVLTGCAIAMGKKFSGFENIPPNQAEIYVIRTEAIVHGSIAPIAIDGSEIGHLKRGGYLLSRVKPGRHIVSTVKSSWPVWNLNQHVQLNVEVGKRYFVRLHSTKGASYSTLNGTHTTILFNFFQDTEESAKKILPTLSLSTK